MDGVTPAIWLFLFSALFLFIAGGVGICVIADRTTENAKSKYRQFLHQRGKLRDFEKWLKQEVKHWPIYARPVLFTEIDQAAQRAFANVHYAIDQARAISRELRPPMEIPTDMWERISLIAAWERIRYNQNIVQNANAFRGFLARIEQVVTKVFPDLHTQEENKKKHVKAKLEIMKQRLENAQSKVTPDKNTPEFYDLVGWALSYAEIGIQAAEQKVVLEDKDALNYAIADVFIHLSKYLLDHFELSIANLDQSTLYGHRFILDDFEKRLENFGKRLRQTIEPQALVIQDKHLDTTNGHTEQVSATHSSFLAWTKTQTRLRSKLGISLGAKESVATWDDTYKFSCMLKLLEIKLSSVRKSFSAFQRQRKIFLDLCARTNATFQQLPHDMHHAAQIEDDCRKYWDHPTKYPKFWLKALDGEINPLPGQEFTRAEAMYREQINPAIRPNTAVKQSKMRDIIAAMNDFLALVRRAKKRTLSLERLLNEHKAAQKAVNECLQSGGSIEQLARELKEIQKDTSDEYQQRCEKYHSQFCEFQERARKVTHADFPSMLSELNDFSQNCKALVSDHQRLIENWEYKCRNAAHNLKAIRTQLVEYIQRTPKIEYDTAKYESLDHEIVQIIQKGQGDLLLSYRWLTAYFREIESVTESATDLIAHFQQQWHEYESIKQETYGKGREIRISLDEYQQYLSSTPWIWAREAAGDIPKTAATQVNDIIKTVRHLEQTNISIRDAIEQCKNAQQKMQSIKKRYLDKLRKIKEQENDFEGQRNALLSQVEPKNMFQMTGKARVRTRAIVENLCNTALRVPEKTHVQTLLDLAQKALETNLTAELEAELENEAKRIYINYGVLVETPDVQGDLNVAGRDIHNNQGGLL